MIRTFGMTACPLKRLRTLLSIPLGFLQLGSTRMKRSDWWRLKRAVPVNEKRGNVSESSPSSNSCNGLSSSVLTQAWSHRFASSSSSSSLPGVETKISLRAERTLLDDGNMLLCGGHLYGPESARCVLLPMDRVMIAYCVGIGRWSSNFVAVVGRVQDCRSASEQIQQSRV